ncbi:MAG: hypothetical protein ACRD5D_02945 [Candidatus Polarisedimenticolia bacterium]
MPAATPPAGPAKSAVPLPVLLAERQGVAFVATPRGVESLRVPRRYWGTEVGVVPIPVSDEEVLGTELLPSGEAGAWPRAQPRPDLLAPALSRLLGGDPMELSLVPGRDGLRAALVDAHGEEHPYPVAPKDAVGFLAAVFHHAPRAVLRTGGSRSPRVLLGVRPAARPNEYRVGLCGLVPGAPPATLADVGMSPSLLEILLEAIDRTVGIVLVAGGPASGRTTTLELLGATLAGRGRRGGLIGGGERTGRRAHPWISGSLTDWPFPESLLQNGPEFVLVDRLEAAELPLAARLADAGTLVLAPAPAADPEALRETIALDVRRGGAPEVPVLVLAQALLRTVCRACVGWRTIPAAQARRHGFHRRDLEMMERQGGFVVPAGKGCAECAGTGARGLTGAFELAAGPAGPSALPRIREEGWRKVMQGVACVEDVVLLPGASRPLRSMREVMVHAGLSPEAIENAEAAGRAVAAVAAPEPRPGAPAPESVHPAGAPVAELATLTALFKSVTSGRTVDAARLKTIAAAVAARGAGDEPIDALLAPSRGFHLAGHSINTAVIAARIASRLGPDTELQGLATLALVHDAGLLQAGVAPADDTAPIASEEAIDPQGTRLRPGPMLAALGLVADPVLEESIRQVHALLHSGEPVPRQRAAGDLRIEVTALACLMELHLHDPGERRPHDLHDVTSLVMEKHGRRFPPPLFRALLKAVPIFPIGSLVELSSGDLARIVSANEGNPFRPRVEIATASGMENAGERRVIDLARAPFLHIRQRVPGSVVGARAVNS